ncbi:facilitated trehalose transporter Tret1-like [Phymastichus coffea]|uniref:facilitated trehalose transporter Tret1-like n=1 Tax=Phymastichus coffea TaxID=108790 RepID=UPI00273ABC03|nr:facilitated trehalose transporter Tret1-like [Phymastichus coffea]
MQISTSPKSQNHGKARQFVTAVILNLATVSFGISCGWSSPVAPQLRSSHSPVGNAAASYDEIAWITSLPAIGGFVTIPFCGSLSERIGRKNFAILSGLPHIVFWLLKIFAQNLNYLYAARFINGMAIAMTVFIVPVYTSEVATEDVRGVIGSLLLFSINIGILFAYIVGAFLSYRLLGILSLIFPVVFVVAMTFIPETPAYLVRRHRPIEARKSLMFYRGNNRALVEQELFHLRSTSSSYDHSAKTDVSLSEFFRDRASRKGLIISMGLLAAQQLSGIVAMTNYAETIFKLAGSSVSSEISSIIVATIQIIGSQASTMSMERAGRRLLSLISCFGMASSLGIVAIFFHMQKNNYNVSSISWLPLIALSSFIIAYCLGIGPVPFVIVSEVFDLKVSSLATTLCFAFFFIIGFTGLRTFDLMMQFYGIDKCFFMLVAISVTSFVFCYCFLPETKGRKREDIINELTGNDKVRLALDVDSKLLKKLESV